MSAILVRAAQCSILRRSSLTGGTIMQTVSFTFCFMSILLLTVYWLAGRGVVQSSQKDRGRLCIAVAINIERKTQSNYSYISENLFSHFRLWGSSACTIFTWTILNSQSGYASFHECEHVSCCVLYLSVVILLQPWDTQPSTAMLSWDKRYTTLYSNVILR